MAYLLLLSVDLLVHKSCHATIDGYQSFFDFILWINVNCFLVTAGAVSLVPLFSED